MFINPRRMGCGVVFAVCCLMPIPGHANGVRFDPRSKLGDLLAVNAASLAAASLAYDLEIAEDLVTSTSSATLSSEAQSKLPPKYRFVRGYADVYSGFNGLVIEATVAPRHRIYATAGTQVFENADFRDWASLFTLARAQTSSDSALLMAADAATYAQSPDGGEVIFTGQSQGGILAQGLAFLTQSLINGDGNRNTHLLHVVAWGAMGSLETITSLILRSQKSTTRDFDSTLTDYWTRTSADFRRAQDLWNKVRPRWRGFTLERANNEIANVVSEIHVIGFFFAADVFAHIGTFIGAAFLLPAKLAEPESGEETRVDTSLGSKSGTVGNVMESHFLIGFERALKRGGLAQAKPTPRPASGFASKVQALLDPLGDLWLYDLYLTKIGKSDAHWRQCQEAKKWKTDRNSWCEKPYWPGCSRSTASWCFPR